MSPVLKRRIACDICGATITDKPQHNELDWYTVMKHRDWVGPHSSTYWCPDCMEAAMNAAMDRS